ncbi:unnamed protein product [Meganyctiphanes norvegica]|uniref:NADH dehydrogenase subunit 4L n=1 Tax=Meganyctiphanes norvegica TaxID=48144 RepID=A0AAV2PKM4_MEGNR
MKQKVPDRAMTPRTMISKIPSTSLTCSLVMPWVMIGMALMILEVSLVILDMALMFLRMPLMILEIMSNTISLINLVITDILTCFCMVNQNLISAFKCKNE